MEKFVTITSGKEFSVFSITNKTEILNKKSTLAVCFE